MSWVYRPSHPLADEFGMVEKHLAGEPIRARSDLAFPMIVSDQIELKSMVDGQTYTSKRALRASYRERGYVEVGNEELKAPATKKPDRRAVRNSVEKAFAQSGLS